MENERKKVMLSGIKPSGDLTLGSYLGPLHHWPEMIEEYDCYYFMADLHAITVRQNPAGLRHAFRLHQHAALTVNHQQYGDNNFIGGNPKQEGRKNHAGKPHQGAQRL